MKEQAPHGHYQSRRTYQPGEISLSSHIRSSSKVYIYIYRIHIGVATRECDYQRFNAREDRSPIEDEADHGGTFGRGGKAKERTGYIQNGEQTAFRGHKIQY